MRQRYLKQTGYIVEFRDLQEQGWLAYLPAFGECACSYVGENKWFAYHGLWHVYKDVMYHYLKTDKPIPPKDKL